MRSPTVVVIPAVLATWAGALLGCGGDPAPSALRVNPASAQVGVGQVAELSAYFVIDGSSERVTEAVVWDSSVVLVATVRPLDAGRAEVSGVAAGTSLVSASAARLRGEAMVQVLGAPAVLETSPTDGATAVARPVDIELTFSVAMEPASLTAQTAAGACSGSIQLSRDDFATCEPFAAAPALSGGDTVATLTPSPGLPGATTFKLRVTTDARSADGVPLVATFTHATGFTTAAPEPCATGVVISQLYGGGGGTGAPYTHDFVELHNAGATPRSLAGMALQYAGSGGTGAWGVQALPTVTIPAGGYYLIQEASASPGMGGALPTPDFVPGTAINLGATAGKVALTSTTTALNGVCPTSNVVDAVGYGTSNCAEGTAPAPAPSNTTAVQRRSLGCIDAGQNGSDFIVAAPAPRNATTAASVCACLARTP